MSWLEWWNFMFLLPLIVGLVLGVALVATGALGDLSGLEGGDNPEGFASDSSGQLDTSAGNALSQILSFFGLAQGVPISVMLPILLMSGGLSGLIFNSVFALLFQSPLFFATFSLMMSFVLTAFLGQGIAKLLRRFFQPNSGAIGAADLIGREAKAVYAISEHAGVAHVKDPFGNIHRITCRALTAPGEIPAGKAIIIKDYDPHSGAYLVELVGLEKGNI